MQPLIHLTAFILLLVSQTVSADEPSPLKVVATIKPLHSLIASLMHGTTEPQLLLNTTQSIHHTSLRPSDHRKLTAADIVFWAGPALETFIPAFEKKYQNTTFVSLMQAQNITLLPARGKHDEIHEAAVAIDPHFWLSPYNAKQIITAATQALITLDKNNASLYMHNQTQTLKRIHTLAKQLDDKLGNLKTPFITYHDAYQYFENEHQLNRLTSVSLNEETTPGIRQIRSIKKRMAQQQINCIFFDAPAKPPIISTLLADSDAQATELDALGFRLKAGADLWFDLLDKIGETMVQCLRQR